MDGMFPNYIPPGAPAPPGWNQQGRGTLGKRGMGGTYAPMPYSNTPAGRVASAGYFAQQRGPVGGLRAPGMPRPTSSMAGQAMQHRADMMSGGVRPGEMPQMNAVEQARMAEQRRMQMGAQMGNNQPGAPGGGGAALAGYMMGR